MTILREIVFDTETTGTDHASGDRVVEIGALELLNHIPTGKHFHRYVNPERDCHPDAYKVHGLSDMFLSQKELFAVMADELFDFFGDAKLVAHNATFDIGFLNAEFRRTGHGVLVMERVVDTLALARRRHPGASNSLDALCLRYGIDNTKRTKHGALLDAELLADVYIELLGGRQAGLDLVALPAATWAVGGGLSSGEDVRARPVRSRVSEAEREAHAAFVATLGAGSVWAGYAPNA